MIWPEAAITLFEQEATPFIEAMACTREQTAARRWCSVCPGYERLPDGSVAFRNMAAVVGNGSGHYIKRRLVPFGEYVPLEGLLRGAIEFFDLPMSHAESGPLSQPLLQAGHWKLATAICYEVVYPNLVRRDARDADVIVTISNDSWFGHSIGPHQHLQMVRMRALENGRYVLRCDQQRPHRDRRADRRGRLRRRRSSNRSCSTERSAACQGVTPYGATGDVPVLAALVDRDRDFAVFPSRVAGSGERLRRVACALAELSFAGRSITVRAFPQHARIMSSNADRYDPQAIENKWQAEWVRRGTNTFTEAQIRAREGPVLST